MSSIRLYETASKMWEISCVDLGDLTSLENDAHVTGMTNFPTSKRGPSPWEGSPAGGNLATLQGDNVDELKLYTASSLPNDSFIRLQGQDTRFGGYMFLNNMTAGAQMYVNSTEQPKSDCYLATATISGVRYLGFLIIRNYPGNDELDRSWGFYYNDSAHQLYVDLNLTQPGDPGFVPSGNKGHRPTGGGTDSGWKPVYPGDNLTQPGAPDETVASAAGSGFLTAYKISSNNLRLLGEALFGGLLTKLANIFVDPLDSIVSLQVFPCEPTVGSSEYIKLFNYSCKRDVLGVDTSAPPLTKQFKVFNFGTLSVAEMWNSFLDYDATSFELYLPFIGSVDIPVGEVMNGSINVQYTVDFYTGMCVANVLCTKTLTLSDGTSVSQQCQHSYMGNCSVQIPLHRESYASFVGALANAAASGLRAPVSLVQSALSGAFKPNIETKGTISANAGYCSILYPYITITRPVTAMPASYQEVVGFPCYIANKLSECSDLCVCDNIDLSGLAGATDSEMDRIRQMCKDGVYV